ncbi:DNA -binding domain-containing protein [Dongia sp.]
MRDTVKDLVRDGLAMIQGGYRQLLRHRRRS